MNLTNQTDGNATHEPTIIDHHTHYLEIDGYDETIEMTMSEHKLLHIRLRKTGKCNIPVDELAKISRAAHSRKRILYKHRENEAAIEFLETYLDENHSAILAEIATHENERNAKARATYAAKKLEAQA